MRRRNISPEVKDRYPVIPCKRIAGMRDTLVPDYLGLDLEITWNVAQVEIPELKTKMLEVRRDLEAEDGFDRRSLRLMGMCDIAGARVSQQYIFSYTSFQ